ncbi:MAG: Crp/Fnr family transcriptional regulator [Chloroflexi bacterium]|nr:Crp/Fnr family transcriptional regulator [Chloroflexota bacterium]
MPTCAAGVPYLRVLPAEAMAELGRSMRHRHVERGEILALTGDPVEHLTVVANGRLKLVQSASGGREQVLRTLGPGEFLGELALFTVAHYEGDFVALEPSDVCLVSRQAMHDLIGRYPDVAVRLMEALAQRLTTAERAIGDLGLRDVSQRLAGELLRAAEDGERTHDGIKVRLTVPWTEIAARIGTTPESLSRRLKSLAAEGILRQERSRTVVLLDPDRLRHLADG